MASTNTGYLPLLAPHQQRLLDMLNDQRARTTTTTSRDQEDSDDATEVREIHALITPQPSSTSAAGRRRESWELSSHRSSSLSIGSEVENFTTMSREFNALVVAGSTMQTDHNSATAPASDATATNLGRIREEELLVETNPLAIVPDSNPIPSPRRAMVNGPSTASTSDNSNSNSNTIEEVSVHMVKKEEAESKIAAWQTAEIAKINNRLKREDVVISGWEIEQVDKATTWLKQVERKLDEKRARAIEKMQNNVAKARRKAAEKRASVEAKRGTKVAKVLDMANLLRAVGRAPSKRSFF